MTTLRLDPAAELEGLAAGTKPHLIGVRHHSPALASVMPAMLAEAAPDVICVELPADFDRWLPHLADPGTRAPVALAGAYPDGGLAFYPFADFSPELAAVRWAYAHGVRVRCCDLPLTATADGAADQAVQGPQITFAAALAARSTGRDGDDMWDRAVEVLAPGCAPEAVRRAGLGVGWALRRDAEAAGGVPTRDLVREAYMRKVVAEAAADGSRVTAVIGAFHAPALTAFPGDEVPPEARGEVVTSLVAYSFDLLDSRSGYPAGIRDPRWQQQVYAAGGDPAKIEEAAAHVVTAVCRALRDAGHTAGTGEAAEALRVAGDLARLRGLPAPGRGEIVEAITTVLGQGERLGRGRALARAMEGVLVGTERGRTAPGTPRSGLGPAVEADLEALRLPRPDEPGPKEVRLNPLGSALDTRRELLLHRLAACSAGYGEQLEVAGTGDGTALTTKWRLAWTVAVPARLDLAGVRGVTAAQAAEGALRAAYRREGADGVTCGLLLRQLEAAARCDLPGLLADLVAEAETLLPSAATLAELVVALDLLEAVGRGHIPGLTADERVGRRVRALGDLLVETAVAGIPGLAGSDRPEDAVALAGLAGRAAEDRLGLRLDESLAELCRTGSPLMQGAATAARVMLGLDDSAVMGGRVAGWVDVATRPETRRALTGRLTGLLAAAGPLLHAAPSALRPLMERVENLSDEGFLARLPALRGGFDILGPAARDRVLAEVQDRLGTRPDLTLTASPGMLATWHGADAAGRAVLAALNLPLPVAEAAEPTPSPAPTRAPAVPRRIAAVDRWRLLLGRERGGLPASCRGYGRALDELYGAGSGEGSQDLGAGTEASFPSARDWSEELQALFGADVREEVLADAAAAGRLDVLAELDPAAARPSVELLTAVLTLAGGLPEQRLAALRPLVRRIVEELARELATTLRPALSGLATPRPTRRSGGPLDLPRTLRANLAHARRTADGRTVVVPERPVFKTRARQQADWRMILVVDVSGSMEASVIWSALTASILAGVPTLSTHFLAFSTQVIDFTDHVKDPLSLLLDVKVGGGTHIAAGLAHARSLVTVPSRTLVAVVSDFEEGAPPEGMLGEVRALAQSGVHLLGCAALDDRGAPRYSVPTARRLAAAGMPVAALSPLALARWVGDRLRGERA
ncbi:vWA domain-containing protein [Rhizohabitans arisaemae]|uniref:vWA domain-containing protein n=1 Tax=Rhizohabitans arisaemae TaxID=2720610 RepID=UPI0024B1126F|nr:DUF5682 family protein [Rhizohabitans arisaemae]